MMYRGRLGAVGAVDLVEYRGVTVRGVTRGIADRGW